VFRYTDGSRSPYGGFELTDARYGIEGHRVITSAARKTISSIEIESGYGGPFETFWMQLEEGAVATSYEPYFDGGEATTPTLMCAADGTCQSTYDTQTGEFVNWWWDKITFDGSEVWSAINDLNTNFGFCTLAKIQEFDHNAHFWSNQTLPDRLTTSLDGTPMLQYTPGLGLIAYDFGFYDKTLNDLGKANWKAHLAEHPLEVWVARNEPEITTIGPQPLTCPTGYGQIIQTAGDIPDCPMEIQYLAHGGNVK